MPTVKNLMGAGCPALQAVASVGVATTAFIPNGAGVQTGLTIPSDGVICTSIASSGYCQLPTAAVQNPGLFDSYILVNHSGSTVQVSPTSAGKIANGSAGAAFAVTTGKTAFFYYIGSDNWAAALSA